MKAWPITGWADSVETTLGELLLVVPTRVGFEVFPGDRIRGLLAEHPQHLADRRIARPPTTFCRRFPRKVVSSSAAAGRASAGRKPAPPRRADSRRCRGTSPSRGRR